jgi:hypothetical protein
VSNLKSPGRLAALRAAVEAHKHRNTVKPDARSASTHMVEEHGPGGRSVIVYAGPSLGPFDDYEPAWEVLLPGRTPGVTGSLLGGHRRPRNGRL